MAWLMTAYDESSLWTWTRSTERPRRHCHHHPTVAVRRCLALLKMGNERAWRQRTTV